MTTTPEPSRRPVGNAVMQVRGGTAATITYRINEDAERTESQVSLPWERPFTVFDQVQSSVAAKDGGGDLICTIVMDGNLVAFQTGPAPSCSFAYYG